jgi:hypothetical protein
MRRIFITISFSLRFDSSIRNSSSFMHGDLHTARHR